MGIAGSSLCSSPSDLLYEILPRRSVPLAAHVERLELEEKSASHLCFDRTLTLKVIRAFAQRSHEGVVCLGDGFASNDQLEIKAVQSFQTKGMTTFRTM